jgi:ankyrin repeat protein
MAIVNQALEESVVRRRDIVNATDPDVAYVFSGRSPLWELMGSRTQNTDFRIKCTEALIEAGAKVKTLGLEDIKINLANDEGYTPLIKAAENGHTAEVLLLLEAGADWRLDTGEWAGTAMKKAREEKRKGVVATLEKWISEQGTEKERNQMLVEKRESQIIAMEEAVKAGKVVEVKEILEDGADPNAADGVGQTALINAAGYNQVGCMEALGEAGADLDKANVHGDTPLMMAMYKGHCHALSWLLRQGANWRLNQGRGGRRRRLSDTHGEVDNILDAWIADHKDAVFGGVNADLLAAAEKGDVKALNSALAEGAEADGVHPIPDPENYGPRFERGLVLRFSRPDIGSKLRSTAMMFAAYNSHINCMEVLVNAGADVNKAGSDSMTPLILAASLASFEGGPATVMWLLEHQADWRLKDMYGNTALDAAKMIHGAEETITALEDWISDKGTQEEVAEMEEQKKTTALVKAVKKGDANLEAVKGMLINGADPNAVEKGTLETAMCCAARGPSESRKPSAKCLHELSEKGGDLNALNRFGWTLMMIAAHSASKDVVEYLLSIGQNPEKKNAHDQTALDLLLSYIKSQGFSNSRLADIDARLKHLQDRENEQQKKLDDDEELLTGSQQVAATPDVEDLSDLFRLTDKEKADIEADLVNIKKLIALETDKQSVLETREVLEEWILANGQDDTKREINQRVQNAALMEALTRTNPYHTNSLIDDRPSAVQSEVSAWLKSQGEGPQLTRDVFLYFRFHDISEDEWLGELQDPNSICNLEKIKGLISGKGAEASGSRTGSTDWVWKDYFAYIGGVFKKSKQRAEEQIASTKKDIAEAIRQGAAVDDVSENGFTPLYEATLKENIDGINQLIAAEADLEKTTTRSGWTPLILAAMKDYLGCVDALVVGGADVNKTDERGKTPLMHAAEAGSLMALERLLAVDGIIPDAVDKNGLTAYRYALLGQESNPDETEEKKTRRNWIVDKLRGLLNVEQSPEQSQEQSQEQEPEPQTIQQDLTEEEKEQLNIALISAVRKKETEEVQRILHEGADPNASDTDGSSALWIATNDNHIDSVQKLCGAGANVNLIDPDFGQTPLMSAAELNSVPAINCLLEAGADWTLTDGESKTALDIAKEENADEAVAALEKWIEEHP